MSAILIDGKAIAEKLRQNLIEKTDKLKEDYGIVPGLAVILVGDDPASQIYVRNKTAVCEKLGFYSKQYTMQEDTTTDKLLDLIHTLNNDDKIHGILVQLPLPKQIDQTKIIDAIISEKDVDAFNKENTGKVMRGDYGFLPCTPMAVVELIKATGYKIEGSNCVIVGRSNIVGKPLAMLMINENATVTICHSKTKNMSEICKQADILVSATGFAKLIKADYIKPGAIVIDVGINRDANGKLCGDVDFEEAAKVAGYITPVPGGVGPMTIAKLMENTYISAINPLKAKTAIF